MNRRPREAPSAVRTDVLAHARISTRHEQVREIGARNQQDEHHGELQHDERALHAADDVVVQRVHPEPVDGGTRHVARGHHGPPLIQQAVHVCQRLLAGDAILQAPDEIQEMRAARIGEVGRIDRQRTPNLDFRVMDVVTLRHDADHLFLAAIDADVRPHHRFIGAEHPRPDFVREDDDRRRIGRRVFRLEPPASIRLDPERRHQFGRDKRAHRTRRRRDLQICGANRVSADRGERLVVVAEFDELGRRDPELVEPQPRKLAGDVFQPVRLRIPERPQQHAVNHGEHGRIGANAQHQRQHRDERERRLTPERPQRVGQVLHGRIRRVCKC